MMDLETKKTWRSYIIRKYLIALATRKIGDALEGVKNSRRDPLEGINWFFGHFPTQKRFARRQKIEFWAISYRKEMR